METFLVCADAAIAANTSNARTANLFMIGVVLTNSPYKVTEFSQEMKVPDRGSALYQMNGKTLYFTRCLYSL